MIKTAHINILETSTVTLPAGTEDTDFPLYRLYDRHVGRLFKTTSAVTTEIKVDQGATGTRSVDTLIVPQAHNLDGMTLDVKHSDDDQTYTPAVAQWTADEGLIEKSWAAVAARYWKFIITAPGSIPEIPELFLTETYDWAKDPARPTGPLSDQGNVERAETFGGKARFLVKGSARKRRGYSVRRCKEAQKNQMASLQATMDAGKPFWLYDGSSWLYGELRIPMDIREVAYGTYSYEFDFLEVLP
jgi:hypothetical protein